MEEKFFPVPAKYFYKFIKENKLVEKYEGMHSFFYTSDGECLAKRWHGFASDEYQIKGDPNFETLIWINDKFNL